jgi:type VI secretion system protein ImpC
MDSSGPRERIHTLVRRLDDLISAQLGEILADQGFRRLEATWRGLWHLVSNVPPGANVRVVLLDASRKELQKDLERAAEVDQSALFRKLVTEPATTAGQPLPGLLLGDFELSNHPQDMYLLEKLATVARAAGAPFVAAAGPTLFGIESFEELGAVPALARIFDKTEYSIWRSFRSSPVACFAALTLPGAVLRPSWAASGATFRGFEFRPIPGRNEPLAGSAAWAWAVCAVRAFANDGWFAEVRGEDGGASELPPRMALIPPFEGQASFHDFRERELSDLGFLPLVPFPDVGGGAFFSSRSCERRRRYDTEAMTESGNYSGDLAHVLSYLRLVQTARALYRDRAPEAPPWSPAQARDRLMTWLRTYSQLEFAATPEASARAPLQDFNVDVRNEPVPGLPGALRVAFFLGANHLLPYPPAALRFETILRTRSS